MTPVAKPMGAFASSFKPLGYQRSEQAADTEATDKGSNELEVFHLVERPRTPDLASHCGRPSELDTGDGPLLRAPARVEHHAQDAVDAEPVGVPESGVGGILNCHGRVIFAISSRMQFSSWLCPIRALARPPIVATVGLHTINRDVRRDPPLAGVVGCPPSGPVVGYSRLRRRRVRTTRQAVKPFVRVASSLALLDCRSLHADVLVRASIRPIQFSGISW